MKTVAMGLLATTVCFSPCFAATYVTDTETYTGLGDQLGTPFDQLIFNSVTGSIYGPGTYLLNTVDFVVGLNSDRDSMSTGSFTNTLTVDGAAYSYTIPYTLNISSSDSIALGGNTVYYGLYKVVFNKLTFDNISSGTVSGDLTFTLGTPEPATWSMMIMGFGAVGYALRRRRTVAVSYA